MIYKRTFASIYVPLLPRLCDGLSVRVTSVGPARNAAGGLGKSHVVTLDVANAADYAAFNERVTTAVQLVQAESNVYYDQPHIKSVRRVGRYGIPQTTYARLMTVVLTKMPW